MNTFIAAITTSKITFCYITIIETNDFKSFSKCKYSVFGWSIRVESPKMSCKVNKSQINDDNIAVSH